MIPTVILLAITGIFNALFVVFPVITELPWGTDYPIQVMFGTARAFMVDFWPIQAPFYAMLSLLTLYASLMFVRMLLGSRAPH